MPKASLIMFSGDLDKALAGFVIATGAAAAGWQVTMFFTFWGINILRDPKKKAPESKDMMSEMFEVMMPRGAKKLKLSRMNMGGMGTSMMKRRMNAKKVKQLEAFIEDAKELDVEFLVCDMSMDLMGLQKGEFIDAADKIVGVGTYLQESKGADVTLFI